MQYLMLNLIRKEAAKPPKSKYKGKGTKAKPAKVMADADVPNSKAAKGARSWDNDSQPDLYRTAQELFPNFAPDRLRVMVDTRQITPEILAEAAAYKWGRTTWEKLSATTKKLWSADEQAPNNLTAPLQLPELSSRGWRLEDIPWIEEFVESRWGSNKAKAKVADIIDVGDVEPNKGQKINPLLRPFEVIGRKTVDGAKWVKEHPWRTSLGALTGGGLTALTAALMGDDDASGGSTGENKKDKGAKDTSENKDKEDKSYLGGYIGGGTGALAGGLLGYYLTNNKKRKLWERILATAAGTIGGGALGGAIGHAFDSDGEAKPEQGEKSSEKA